MLDHVFRRPSVRARIRANPLGHWLPNDCASLEAGGHLPKIIQRSVRAVEHFGSWLDSEHLAPVEITRATVRSFPPAGRWIVSRGRCPMTRFAGSLTPSTRYPVREWKIAFRERWRSPVPTARR